MKTRIAETYGISQSFRVRKTGNDWRIPFEEFPLHFRWRISVAVLVLVLMLVPLPLLAQGGHGGSGGGGGGHGGGGCGDVFGDLIHILRDEQTGQPILAQRWIELPANEPGYGWGYCPIAVYQVVDNNHPNDKEKRITVPVGFMPYSCDPDPSDAGLIVEVDYFGRLNGGRTKEKNSRMHFNEVISNIKQADRVKLDPAGRFMFGFDCVEAGDCHWSTVDSPMENLSLYTRLMKYGHIATDPFEVDQWAHGDPSLSTQYHPALTEEDFDKLALAGLTHLLPSGYCWGGSGFHSGCANAQVLEEADFNSASVFLAAAANKHGIITIDLVQYLNRFLKITRETPATQATVDTLPALYMDCWSSEFDPDDPEESDLSVDLQYDNHCNIVDADPDETPNYAMFTDIQERFVNFEQSMYRRQDRRDAKADLILESSTVQGMWLRHNDTYLEDWVEAVNSKYIENKDIGNFVDAASDALRSIEYIHNYAVPENLYCKYAVDAFCSIE